MKRIGLLAIIIMSLNKGFSQNNLVPNPSFEEYIACPTQLSSVSQYIDINQIVKNWLRPNWGTTDYFNACAAPQTDVFVPNNRFGDQMPKMGSAYAGIFVFANEYFPIEDSLTQQNSREYVQVQLTEKLKKDKPYCVEFYVSATYDTSYKDYGYFYATDDIGMYFSKDRITQFGGNDGFLLQVTPQIANNEGNMLADSEEWMLIKGTYIAQGGEEWITIGNYKADNQTSLYLMYEDTSHLASSPNVWVSYYYIDDVSVREITALHNPQNDTFVCENQSFSKELMAEIGSLYYHWSTGDTTQKISIYNAGIYWYTADYGCGEVTDTIHINPIYMPEMNLGNDISQCENLPQISLQGSEGFSHYLWNNGDTTQSTTIAQSGIYYVTGSHICGTKTDTIQVNYFPIPNLPQVKDTSYCENENAIPLQAIGTNLLWYNSLSDNIGDTIPPIPATNSSGIYDYYVTQTKHNCESEKAKITVKIAALPQFSLPNTYNMCENDKVEIGITPQENCLYSWNTNEKTPTIQIHEAGIYELFATNNCGVFSQETSIKAYNCDLCIIIPNAFSPNFDGNNDTFFPVIRCPLIDYTFIIFDRWGRKIVETNDPNYEWNGTNKGQNAPEGVYTYRIFYTNPLNKISQNIGGTITLIR